VKIETGISTLVPVLGIAYRRHSISPAQASAGTKPRDNGGEQTLRTHGTISGPIEAQSNR